MEMGGNSWSIWQGNSQQLISEEEVGHEEVEGTKEATQVCGLGAWVNDRATRCKERVWGKRAQVWCETHWGDPGG